MIDEEAIARQLEHTLAETDFPALGAKYRGKVRDVYRTAERMVIITTDRVSAFDHVLGTIPFKGEVLNAIAVDGFQRTQDLVPNHLLSAPDPNVLVVKPARAFPVEFVVRGHLTGSLWRDYEAGRAGVYEVDLPPGLKKDQRFEAPILTPSTKAEIGRHDEPISKRGILERGLMTKSDLEEAEAAALALFSRGVEISAARGLILVDTKYELGRDDEGRLMVIDEIHTPDSSRYWIAEGSRERFLEGRPQQMLDKENLREWLIHEHGFSGHGTPPALNREIRVRLARFYLELHERLLGRALAPTGGNPLGRIHANLQRAGFLSAG